jgi:hypothetical protein
MSRPAALQPPLPFASQALPPFGVLEASSCHRAVRLLEGWRDWPGGALVLTGANEAVRAALAARWTAHVEATGASVGLWSGAQDVPLEPAALVEGEAHDPVALFALLSAVEAGRVRLLVTADRAPQAWDAPFSDLRSRLTSLPVERLADPEAPVLAELLIAYARAGGCALGPELAAWATERMAPVWPGPRALVAAILTRIGLPRTLSRADFVSALAEIDFDPDEPDGPT